MQKKIVLAIAISFMLLASGLALACTTSDIIVDIHQDRPDANGGSTPYSHVDFTANMIGFNQLQIKDTANLGSSDLLAIAKTQPCVSGAAPYEETHISGFINSAKGGTPMDPAFWSQIDTWTTVGCVGLDSTIPANRYDTNLFNMHIYYDAANNNLRGIDTMGILATDDMAKIMTGNNAGYTTAVMGSWSQLYLPGENQKMMDALYSDKSNWNPLTGYSITTDIQAQMRDTPWNYL